MRFHAEEGAFTGTRIRPTIGIKGFCKAARTVPPRLRSVLWPNCSKELPKRIGYKKQSSQDALLIWRAISCRTSHRLNSWILVNLADRFTQRWLRSSTLRGEGWLLTATQCTSRLSLVTTVRSISSPPAFEGWVIWNHILKAVR